MTLWLGLKCTNHDDSIAVYPYHDTINSFYKGYPTNVNFINTKLERQKILHGKHSYIENFGGNKRDLRKVGKTCML